MNTEKWVWVYVGLLACGLIISAWSTHILHVRLTAVEERTCP